MVWSGYLDSARKTGSTTTFRHYWELCVLLGLRDGLRSGDVYVRGSRRYADPAAYLLTPQQWEPQRTEFCRLVGRSADYLADPALRREVHGGLQVVEHWNPGNEIIRYGSDGEPRPRGGSDRRPVSGWLSEMGATR